MPGRNVIIGGGAAGTYAIDTIRVFDREAEITLICDEPSYARMALPYYVAGQVPEGQVITGTPDYFAKRDVTPLLGRRAASIDPSAHHVVLDDGTEVPYDQLLLATGSRAQRIPVPGAELPGVETLWTLEDANAALRSLPDNAEVVLVGAGFIGLIVLNALFKRGCRLKVVEIAGHVLPRMLDPVSAALAESWLTRQGVELYTGQQVTGIEGEGRKKVSLSGGGSLEADLVVLATGITPNVELARAAGLEVGTGIAIDRRCLTSAPGVYAAGDCAEGPDLLTGEKAVHAIQPTAVDHGRVAGANMAGQGVEYPGSLLMNILDVCGLQCASFGNWSGEGAVIRNEGLPLYRKLVWEGGRMVGAIFAGPMNDVCMLNDVGMVKGFIQSRADLGHWKGYIDENPADLRRPYVGARIAECLLEFQLLGRPAESRGYRFEDRQPEIRRTEAHRLFTATQDEVAGAS